MKPKILFRVSKRHWLGRPPTDDGLSDVLRLTAEGFWIVDDGQPGFAFSGLTKNGCPTAWHPACWCCFDKECPATVASDCTAKRFGCSNGLRMVRPSGADATTEIP